jgi:parvulin-like peptidyl-prolyl isomerase
MTAEKHHDEPAMEQPVPIKDEDAKPAKKKSAPALRNFMLGGLLAVVVLALGLLGLMTLGIYKLGWSGAAASKIAHALPYPVATVNSNPIRYAEYLDDIATLTHFYEKQADQVAAQGGTLPTEAEIRQNVMDRLVRNEVLKEEAVKYDVSVSDADIEEEFARLVGQAGGDEMTEAAKQEKVKSDITELYGWTIAQFKVKVLAPYLLEQKLGEVIGKDQALNAEAEAKANEVLAKVNAGEDFGELAKTYSADFASGQNGGDLDWFGRGVMVKEFEDAAFALKKGKVSGLVRTNFGFHIIKVDDIELKDNEVSRVRARHILIPAATAEQYIQKAIDNAKIKELIDIGGAAAPQDSGKDLGL